MQQELYYATGHLGIIWNPKPEQMEAYLEKFSWCLIGGS